jgi:hypothetical protein
MENPTWRNEITMFLDKCRKENNLKGKKASLFLKK